MKKEASASLNAAHLRSVQIQRKIFNSLKRQIATLFGKMPASLASYEKESQRDFRISLKYLTPIAKEQFISALQTAEVIFIGDFHTYDQAQRTALRILRETLANSHSHTGWALGLELMPSTLQTCLDKFQAGTLSLEEFHHQIDYENAWGFPWKHYSPLFRWAKQQNIKLLGLNAPPNVTDLNARDRWASQIIFDYFKNQNRQAHPTKLFILYGEHHLGSKHLPKEVKTLDPSLSTMIVHQNSDSLYWKLALSQSPLNGEILKINKNTFCIFSGTPWAKWASLLQWVEEGRLKEETDEDGSEREPDYLSWIHHSGKWIGEFFKINSPSFDNLTVFTTEQMEELEALLDQAVEKGILSTLDRNWVNQHLLCDFRIYLPQLRIAYLGTPSHNRATEISGIYWREELFGEHPLFRGTPEGLFHLLLNECFGFLGSLLLNPQRKCDLIQDHLDRIQDLNVGKAPSYPYEKKARESALLLLKEPQQGKIPKHIRATFPWAVAAKYAGQILGKKIYQALHQGQIHTDFIWKLFLKGDFNPVMSSQDRYCLLLKKTSIVKLALSKKDRF